MKTDAKIKNYSDCSLSKAPAEIDLTILESDVNILEIELKLAKAKREVISFKHDKAVTFQHSVNKGFKVFASALESSSDDESKISEIGSTSDDNGMPIGLEWSQDKGNLKI